MAMNLTSTTIPIQIPTPTFTLETKNHDQDTTMLLTRKRREAESAREPPAKSRSCTVRDLIEEDTNRMERYEVESEKEGTSSKGPITSRETSRKRRSSKLKDMEVMQVVEHIPGIVSFSAADGEGVEMPH